MSTPEETPRRILSFARDCLGPASEHHLQDPELLARVLGRIRSGVDLEDAVLGAVFESVGEGGPLADEFLGYFLEDLLRLERPRLRGSLRRFLDTGDLAQSVLGDLWGEIRAVRFEERGAFLGYLAQRVSHKAIDRARHFGRMKRGEDHRIDVQPHDLPLATEEASPLSRAGNEEERDNLVLLLLRLPERDRRILTMYLRGDSLAAISQAIGLEVTSARKALQRAIRKARVLGDRGRSQRQTRASHDGYRDDSEGGSE